MLFNRKQRRLSKEEKEKENVKRSHPTRSSSRPHTATPKHPLSDLRVMFAYSSKLISSANPITHTFSPLLVLRTELVLMVLGWQAERYRNRPEEKASWWNCSGEQSCKSQRLVVFPLPKFFSFYSTLWAWNIRVAIGVIIIILLSDPTLFTDIAYTERFPDS